MSIEKFDHAISLLKKNFSEDEIYFTGPFTDRTILNAEEALDLKFPNTYRKFLKEYGSDGFKSEEIYGLTKEEDFKSLEFEGSTTPNAIWTTLDFHKRYGHPLHLVIIYNLGDGTIYCLDTSQMNDEGECPVVMVPIVGHDNYTNLPIEAKNFGEFFLTLVEEEIEDMHYEDE